MLSGFLYIQPFLFTLGFHMLYLLYLNILVSAVDASEEILNFLLVLLSLMGPVSQYFLEEAVFEVEPDLKLFQNITWSRLDLSQQGAAQILQMR